MGLLSWLNREAGQEPEGSEETGSEFDTDSLDASLRAVFEVIDMDRDKAMQIPSFASAVEFMSLIVAMLPIRLYRKVDDKVDEIEGDRRVRLLNMDTGDLLRAPEMKAAFTRDYLCGRGGFIYVNRQGNEVKSLHYVNCNAVGVEAPTSHIFKEARFNVDGVRYYPWQFIYACRNTTTGVKGVSFVEQASNILTTSYSTMEYEQALVRRGGNKRGFLEAPRKLGEAAIKKLKKAFAKMFRRDGENFVVLNDGVTWKEASETSVEMQLAENKKANTDDIYSLFLIPPSLIRGDAEESDRDNNTRYGVIPMLRIFEAAINHAMLLEEEKDSGFYFEFDLKEFTKANMKDRWQAWAVAKKNGLVQPEEFRSEENMEPLGMNYINLGLQDVLMDPIKQKIIVPNMGRVIDLNNLSEQVNEDPDAAEPPTNLKGGDEVGDQSK